MFLSGHQLWLRLYGKLSGTFLILKENPNYRLYFIASFVSQIGLWLQLTGQAWLVLELTHSGAMLGVLAVCEFGPSAIFGLVGGAIIDRYDNKWLLFWTQASLMLSAATLAALTFTGRVGLTAIFTLAIINSLVSCATIPATQTFVIQIVGRSKVPNALGLGTIRQHFARILGPILGGLVIWTLGVGGNFALNAASFLGVMYAVYFIQLGHPLMRGDGSRRLTLIASLIEGLAYVFYVPRLKLLVVALFLVTFIPMSFVTTIPIFTFKSLGGNASTYGLLFSSLSVGSVFATVIISSKARVDNRWIFASAAGLGLAELFFILERSVLLSVLGFIFAGFCMTAFVLSITSTLLLDAKDQMLGRISALSGYITGTLGPLGSSISGWLCEIGGTNLAFGVGGIIALSVAAIGAISIRMASPVTKR